MKDNSSLWEFDAGFAARSSHDCGYICGIDEAGRGPLAGPVFAGAVILLPGAQIPLLNDSKKLSEKNRDEIFDYLISSGNAYFGIGSADQNEIDEVNILNATFLAMNRAFEAMYAALPDNNKCSLTALVDGNRDPHLPAEKTHLVVKGDAKSASIAAASVLAKVSRDRYMLEMDKKYPEYLFAKHKGYPTALHYEMIKQYGICPIHRKSFLTKRGLVNDR